MARDDFAVLVGINRYPELGNLSGPENDAQDFRDWLCSPTGGDVPSDRVHLHFILSSDYPDPADPIDAEPAVDHVLREFDMLCRLAQQGDGRAGRRLYIYMAGHGFAPSLEDAALLMANAAKGRLGHHVQGRPYANHFRKAAYFDEVVLFMDCCRGNYQQVPRNGCHYEEVSSNHVATHFYGFAAEWSRATREGPWGPNGQIRGLFTTALVAGLRGGAADEAGDITSASLETSVLNYIQQIAQKYFEPDGRSEPVFDYDKRKQIVFRTAVAPPFTLRVTLGGANRGKIPQLVDGNLQPVPGTNPAPDQWEWRLRQGLYRIQVAGAADQVHELCGEGRVIDVQI